MYMYVYSFVMSDVEICRISDLTVELGSLSDDFYSALPHKRGQRSHPIDSKRLIAQKQDLCQVRV